MSQITENKKLPIPDISSGELHEALSYSLQHRNILTKALHKVLPDIFPKSVSDETVFYSTLRDTLNKPKLQGKVAKALFDFIDSKPKEKTRRKWTAILDFRLRLYGNALDMRNRLEMNAEKEDAIETGFSFESEAVGEELSLLASRLDELGKPTYGKVYRWMNAVWPIMEGYMSPIHRLLMGVGNGIPMEDSSSEINSSSISDSSENKRLPEAGKEFLAVREPALEWSRTIGLIRTCIQDLEGSPYSIEKSEVLDNLVAGLLETAKSHSASNARLATRLESLGTKISDSDGFSGEFAEQVLSVLSRPLDGAVTVVDSERLELRLDACEKQLQGMDKAQNTLELAKNDIPRAMEDEDYLRVGALSEEAEEAKRCILEERSKITQNLEDVVRLLGLEIGDLSIGLGTITGAESGAKAEVEAVSISGAEAEAEAVSISESEAELGVEFRSGLRESSPLQPNLEQSHEKSTTKSLDAGVSASTLARQACPASNKCEDYSAANALVWALIRDGRYGLAFHLAKALEEQGQSQLEPLKSEIILALFLAPYINSSNSEIVERQREKLAQLLLIPLNLRETRHSQQALVLITYASALRPALFAPDLTGARAVLDEKRIPSVGYSRLHELREAILKTSEMGISLSVASLKGQESEEGWFRQMRDLQETCGSWWKEYRRKNIKYAHTTHVWQHWLEQDGPIGTLMDVVVKNKMQESENVREVVPHWLDRKYVNRELDKTDGELRGRKAKLRPIEGDSRTIIVNLAIEAMGFIRDWLQLVEHKPAGKRRGSQTVAQDWVNKTRTLLLAVETELSEATEDLHSLPDEAALTAAKRTIVELVTLLDPQESVVKLPIWSKALGEELLLAPDIVMDEHWQPEGGYGSPEVLSSLIRVAANPNSWEEAFMDHLERCNHRAGARLLEVIGAMPGTEIPEDEWWVLKDRSMERCQNKLAVRREEVNSAISHAVDYGYLDEDERSRMMEQLELAETDANGNIGRLMQQLDTVIDQIGESKERRIKQERERLHDNKALEQNEALRTRIEALLNKGDIATATEYVTHAESGREPPTDSQFNIFTEHFFPEFLNKVSHELPELQGKDVMGALASGDGLGLIQPPSGEERQSEELLRAWFSIKGRREGVDQSIERLFNAIGFHVESVSSEKSTTKGVSIYTLSGQPVKDRSVCIVPQFGSLARGKYRITCVWDNMSIEELMSHLGSRQKDTPQIILYLNKMPEMKRRDLAYQCRERRRTILVIDELQIYFLLTIERGGRLPAFFQTSFPFTIVNPYSPTSSDVPDELFFGRKRAIEHIMNLRGTNLVFGGRQQGKTALLREVKRHYHDVKRGFVISWIDLKAAGIGFARPSEDIWAVIATELRKADVIPAQATRPETIRARIETWLEKDQHRRLLILLDEADQFFVRDSEDNGYGTLTALKNLMENTERRFKIVFAGLHNVQRMSRDPNSPIKHLSQPVCIGPLLEDGEAREAFRLAALPLRTLGYQIDDDVVNRILSYTNYYPNLIQHFCHSLLEYLNDNAQATFDHRNCPPYTVLQDQVEQAYRRRDLKQFIRDRFQITLDLDPRYRIIALRIALETLERRQQGEDTTAGLSVKQIREEALGWWSVGFKDKSHEAFRTILDEMIGLGILRDADRGYALRSPNIVNLLGTHERIEQDLLDASLQEPPPVYAAATYRRVKGGYRWVRSPFTAEQEYEILQPCNGVAVVFGLRIAGLDYAVPFLLESAKEAPETEVVEVAGIDGVPVFRRRLKALLDKQKAGSNLIVIVGPDNPWSENWVLEATRMVSRKMGRKKIFRVVFIGDPEIAWIWAERTVEFRSLLPDVHTIALKPWSIETMRHWQEDTSVGPLNGQDMDRIENSTGLWSQFVNDVSCQIEPAPEQWRRVLEKLPDTDSDRYTSLRKEVLDIGKPEPVLVVLAQLGEAVSLSDLRELLDSDKRTHVDQAIEWADLLAMVEPLGVDTWRINSFVARSMCD